MRKIISNTTPILSLLKINKLEILKELYNEIIVPTGVYEEIETGKGRNYYVDLQSLEWVKVINVENPATIEYLHELDKGEAEVIVLAKEQKADLVIIDEKLGRYFAKYYNLTLTGTLGILIKAKQLGYIDKIKPLIEKMQEEGIWFNKKLTDKVLKISNE